MGKLTEKEHSFTTDTPNQVVDLGFPGRVNLKKLSMVRIGGGPITVDVYNRAFSGGQISGQFRPLTQGEQQKYVGVFREENLIAFDARQAAAIREGDVVRVEASGETYDDKDLRVRYINQEKNFVLLEYDVAAIKSSLGFISLDIPEAEHPLSQVMPQQSGADHIVYFPEFDGGTLAFHNRDVIDPAYDIGVVRKIYLKVAEPGAYKAVIGGAETI